MAARSEAGALELWDLRKLRPDDLSGLLEEESSRWREALDWDFRPSADLVRRFVRMRALSGLALSWGGEIVGYAYYVSEETKGLIGDLYVLEEFRSIETENRLLDGVLYSLFSTPQLGRVEAQLMLLPLPFERPLPHAANLRRHARHFMAAPLHEVPGLAPRRLPEKIRIDSFSEKLETEAARLIAAAYRGHIDGEINDQYRSVSGARRFLANIVQYPGCGSFFHPGSFVAWGTEPGRLAGLSLASLVAPDVGHITQICTAPEVRGTGIGYELLRRSMAALERHRCRKVSLTVSAANRDAIRLYERVGFSTARRFAALVWGRP